MSESELIHALHALYSRGDMVELALFSKNKDGEFQACSRFANSKGWGVSLAGTAADAVSQRMLQVMSVSHYPDGAVVVKALPERVADWDFDTYEMMGGCDVRIPDSLEERFNRLMDQGFIRSIRWSRCADSHWELGVMYAPNTPGPLHIAAPLDKPAAALLELVEFWEKHRPLPECPDCRGTGQRDSGGEYPWGEPIFVSCDCGPAQVPAAARSLDDEIDDLLG